MSRQTATDQVDTDSPVLSGRQVLADDVYDVMREWILSGRIEPGARIKIDSIAAQVGVSNTPVRQALGRLEADGLVTKRPYRGFIASSLLDLKELRDIYECRLLIEPATAKRAASAMTGTGLESLREALAAAGTVGREHDTRKLVEYDQTLHGRIAALAGNFAVEDVLARMFVRSRNFRSGYPEPGAAAAAAREHQEIVDALDQRDGVRAERAMRAHLQAAVKRMAEQEETRTRHR
ncbi:GntR family transcriptional regulator [Streptomyces sp. NPDC051976]|uniref:GntR family transcriptional regulator n=1 Tax=Streptomyces sp. NPDC051976 TaxID=3154947 RepID=UPI0034146B8B